MIRRHVMFSCEGDQLVGTIDAGENATCGLLIVSGGNEIRSGAFAGQAMLAARLAERGFAVMRFDRRGVGDSEGDNRGFRESAADIEAAVGEFRKQCPSITAFGAFGNCDAASALMLMGGRGFYCLILSNPWTFDEDAKGDVMPPSAIRERYAQKLRNPKEVARALTGGVNIARVARGIKSALSPADEPSSLLADMIAAMQTATVRATFLIAGNDRTGRAFAAQCPGDTALRECEGASHAYVEPHAFAWLEEQIVEALQN